MKFTSALGLSLAVGSVSAHYTFPALTGTSDWQYVRQTLNYQSNGPVTDVTSQQIRCYTNGVRGVQTQTVSAGSTVGFKVSPNIFHEGPLLFYMAKAPSGQDISTWDGSGNVWFKLYEEKPTIQGNQLKWSSLNKGTVSVTIPRSTPSGDYLLRVEHIALHQASQTNGAQFYLSCAQIRVTNGGNGNPGPLVSFPGAYKATDPGIKINVYGGVTQYIPPGPAVWSG
ncbi:fungal cellulose binding domain-containing protein [Westerdykella ornata]|uniref:lytic cellulose monooxygenase (C4-dehydrogenating) n=1 Tax=Westerdykella ornata TaxID=318751 RepID=A0A6A6JGA3_WESOR|nr:fungal cellulose binding domain-containing protein [Westerdykella ornata]KAF2275008.1 fungal cellulose binding domain-containing protein [Westerdykella ornata]